MKKATRLMALILVFALLTPILTMSAGAYSTVRKGSRGNDVKTLQRMLNAVDNAGLSVDGKFGSATLAAVKNFQRKNGLSVDGVVGPKTWAALEAQYAQAAGKESTLKIGSGKYAPGTLTAGKSYSISGKITSNYTITSVTVGVYKSNGNATSQVKTVKPNKTSYNIKNVDSYIKFGKLSGSESGTKYYFKVTATDTSGTTKVLVNQTFTVKKISCDYDWPLPGVTYISSYFGGRIHPLTGRANNHSGIDIGAEAGTKVRAAADGKVYVMYDDCTHNYGKSKSCGCGGGYGNYVYIQHEDGMRSYYAHLSKVSVKNGAKVTQGTVIGTVGSTGSSSGNHLHFEMRSGSSTSTRVDPLDYVEPR